jgi:2-keto-4-pentenoate hydratase
MEFNPEQVAEEFSASADQGIYYPPAWFDRLDMDQALRVQHALLARKVAAGEQHVGWKVGLTAKAIQEQFNIHEPVCGYLLRSGLITSGSELPWADLIGPGVENEICFRMGTDLAGPNATAAMAKAAVQELYPAMELVENRGDLTAQFEVALADNVQQSGFVLGQPVAMHNELDIAAIDATVLINEQQVGEGNATAVLGNPFNSLAWLANKLAELELSVLAGQWVMAGSLTRQFPLNRGDRIHTKFSGLGDVRFGLV